MSNMREQTAKLTAVILCAVFAVLSLHTYAEAAALPDPDTKGSITIHKYQMDSIEGNDELSTGLEVPAEKIPEGALPLPGVKFKVTRVADDSTDPGAAEAVQGGYEDTVKTSSEGLAYFGDLEQGVYLVKELDSPAIEQPAKPFLVRIPMTNPAGDGWIYHVHVYPKNKISSEDVQIDKFISALEQKSETARIGDKITWIIAPTVPADIEEAQKYVITDVLHNALDFDSSSLVIRTVNKAGEKEKVENENDKYYTTKIQDQKLTITFTEAGHKLLGRALSGTGAGSSSIEIEFKTTLNKKAENLLGQEIQNDAQIDYKNSVSTVYTESVEEKPEVHTGGIAVKKIEKGTEKLLSGAEFKVYRSEADAKNDKDAVISPDNANVWVAVSGQDGYAYFKGLAYGEYWIVETKAPSGEDGKPYKLLDSAEKVTVNAENPVAEIIIQNSKDGKGFELPSTGGMGTVIFMIAGAVFVAGAFLLLFLSRRKKEEEARRLR